MDLPPPTEMDRWERDRVAAKGTGKKPGRRRRRRGRKRGKKRDGASQVDSKRLRGAAKIAGDQEGVCGEGGSKERCAVDGGVGV